MIERIKNFCIQIWSKIEDHLARYIAGLIVIFFIFAYLMLSKWCVTMHSLRMYGWTWLFLACLFLISIIYSLVSLFRGRGHFKDPHDITHQIDDWFRNGTLYCPFEVEESISFYNLEDSLYIKKGSSIKYLPILAYKHGYGFEMGKKTFKLTKLRSNNNIKVILEQHLKGYDDDSKEVVIDTYEIDMKLRWPKGTTEQYMKTFKFEGDEEYQVEYKRNGKVVFRLIENKNY